MQEFLNRLSSREKRMITILLVFLLMYSAYKLIIDKSLVKLEDVNSQLESLIEREDELSREIVSYNTLRINYQTYDLNNLEITLPIEGEVHEIVLWIEELFSDTTLTRPRLSFKLMDEQEKYVEVSLEFSGPYESVYSLMDQIENNTRLTKIQSSNLNGNQGQLNANLTMRVYGQAFEELTKGEYDFENYNLFKGQ